VDLTSPLIEETPNASQTPQPSEDVEISPFHHSHPHLLLN